MVEPGKPVIYLISNLNFLHQTKPGFNLIEALIWVLLRLVNAHQLSVNILIVAIGGHYLEYKLAVLFVTIRIQPVTTFRYWRVVIATCSISRWP